MKRGGFFVWSSTAMASYFPKSLVHYRLVGIDDAALICWIACGDDFTMMQNYAEPGSPLQMA